MVKISDNKLIIEISGDENLSIDELLVRYIQNDENSMLFSTKSKSEISSRLSKLHTPITKSEYLNLWHYIGGSYALDEIKMKVEMTESKNDIKMSNIFLDDLDNTPIFFDASHHYILDIERRKRIADLFEWIVNNGKTIYYSRSRNDDLFTSINTQWGSVIFKKAMKF